jgi:tripartite-type tricarboxylate transporter receptor subunit TctC
VLDHLNREVQRLLQEDAAVRGRFNALAVNMADPMTPAQFGAYVRAQHARYAKLIPDLGIK